ncbi:MAG TPA: HD domain-containing phosphohydrolase [Candidatus Angelobacter sp.]|nr:HD domain-containing phosphohydrolase [Candidatus Angelobacter sp.]
MRQYTVLWSAGSGFALEDDSKREREVRELLDTTLDKTLPSHITMAPISERAREEYGRLKARAPKILVVDDKLDTLLLLRELLSTRGYDIITATEAEEAKQMVHSERPELILLDVVMPGKSGYELCRELKEDPFTRLIPVVMITGLSDRDDRVRGIEAGADDFLSKPLYPEELFARVKSLLKLKEFTDELENAEAVLVALALGIESRDPYTGNHCERLAHYAADLGHHIGLDGESIIALKRGGYLHDLGKVSIPDDILKKGTRLTGEEWEIMKQHPIIGEAICRPLKSFRNVLPIIRHHHEHWDGSGYPDRLVGYDIPLLARVLQVVDVYDALRTARPYKPALNHEEAKRVMMDEANKGLWDPNLVPEFFAMLKKKEQAA